jgi:hypothetical protein
MVSRFSLRFLVSKLEKLIKTPVSHAFRAITTRCFEMKLLCRAIRMCSLLNVIVKRRSLNLARYGFMALWHSGNVNTRVYRVLLFVFTVMNRSRP